MRQTLLYILYVVITGIGDMCISIISLLMYIGLFLSLPFVFIQILFKNRG